MSRRRVFNFSGQNFSYPKMGKLYLPVSLRRLTTSSAESFLYNGSSRFLPTHFTVDLMKEMLMYVSVWERDRDKEKYDNRSASEGCNQIIYVKCFESTTHSWKRKVASSRDEESSFPGESKKVSDSNLPWGRGMDGLTKEPRSIRMRKIEM